ncbi:MAG TPA: SGNH/GDSL hydrolase family protein [Chthonomonas sp.]|uniref:SGNH/GDSL hydrolase family protein n=1 Tax=Chthonomonas sp. TaxID=2282153 RepID=UPI002B4AEE2E|nr:SGNH/GDSL hydrolase family protein [Chthonomonas sp.]HLH80457.1 SGNH/GDSL hydrolase family protein [Chthonomonas sp.]
MKIEAGQTLLMIGDSITDAGRARPVGERAFGGLGQGYVCYMDALLGAVYPERQIRVVNMGVSGNTVRDLKARWQSDVLELKPDWLSIMIGINDVWRQFDAPLNPTLHVYPDEYEETLDKLVLQTKPLLRGLVLMTPFYIEPNREDAMRAMMDSYGAIVRGIAEKHGAYFVDTQAAFDEVMRYFYPASIAWDRVHPNPLGHMVLARAFLRAVDFRW